MEIFPRFVRSLPLQGDVDCQSPVESVAVSLALPEFLAMFVVFSVSVGSWVLKQKSAADRASPLRIKVYPWSVLVPAVALGMYIVVFLGLSVGTGAPLELL